MLIFLLKSAVTVWLLLAVVTAVVAILDEEGYIKGNLFDFIYEWFKEFSVILFGTAFLCYIGFIIWFLWTEVK